MSIEAEERRLARETETANFTARATATELCSCGHQEPCDPKTREFLYPCPRTGQGFGLLDPAAVAEFQLAAAMSLAIDVALGGKAK